MSFGDSNCDKPLNDGWKAFCRQLEAAGERVFKDYNPANPQQRVDAFRFLTQNLGQAFDLALETRDTKYPALHDFCNPTRKLGGDCADFVYLQAWIDGESVYRISGNRGSARFLNFTVQGERPDKVPGTDIPSLHDPFGDIPQANLFGHQLISEPDGSFELYIGGPARNGNWLPTTPDTRKLFLRQGFDSWDELPATMNIERVGMSTPKPLPAPEQLLEAMDWAGRFVVALMDDWPDHPYQYSPFVDPDNTNQFPQHTATGEDDQKRGRAAANMCWELEEDEALIVEFDAHDGFWMLTNMGAFMTSMDYLYRPVSYTPSRTKADSDGKNRLIIAHQDPGYHNWLDTQQFRRGNLTYRNMLSQHATEFHTQTVKFDRLEEYLPPDSHRVSAEQRTQQLWTRFRSIRRRYSF